LITLIEPVTNVFTVKSGKLDLGDSSRVNVLIVVPVDGRTLTAGRSRGRQIIRRAKQGSKLFHISLTLKLELGKAVFETAFDVLKSALRRR
jgi:hypothetical protein